MNTLRNRCVLLLLLLPLCSCSALDVLNAAVPDSGYRLVDNISYGPQSRHTLDLYLPSEPVADSQTILFVYGGAWRTGKRADYEFVGQALSSAGHTVIIPDYRLYPEVVFPDFVTDVALAIKSLGTLALPDTQLSDVADVSSIVLMGHSSGAHLVALISSDTRYLRKSDTSVKALIGLAGPYDLPLNNEDVKPVFASAASDELTNPVQLASPGHPATLLIHGSDDERVKPFHTQRYFERLQFLDIDSRLLMIEGAGHAAVVAAIAAPFQSKSKVTPEILAFLDSI